MPTTRRSNGRPTARRAAPLADAARRDAERRARGEIEAWRAAAIPDATAPLDAEDLVRLLGDLTRALALEPAIADGVTVNTVRFYRRKDIIDPPQGRTAAARWGVRHLWQVAGARLAGYLGLVTLAEARDAMRDADAPALLAFLAARVADARARDAVRDARELATAELRMEQNGAAPTARAATTRQPESVRGARPLPGRTRTRTVAEPAMTISLPGGALCVLPASHPALGSPEQARELVRALAGALAND